MSPIVRCVVTLALLLPFTCVAVLIINSVIRGTYTFEKRGRLELAIVTAGALSVLYAVIAVWAEWVSLLLRVLAK